MNISVRTNPVHITDRVNIMNPKLLITLKEADFQWPTIPLKRIILIKTLTKCRSLIQYASFGTFRAKIGRLFTPKSVFKVA